MATALRYVAAPDLGALDPDTVGLAALVVLGFAALVWVLARLGGSRAPAGAVERRAWHAAAARKSANVALGWVGLLVVALLLGRLLLGAMALAGIVVFTALAVVRARLSGR